MRYMCCDLEFQEHLEFTKEEYLQSLEDNSKNKKEVCYEVLCQMPTHEKANTTNDSRNANKRNGEYHYSTASSPNTRKIMM